METTTELKDADCGALPLKEFESLAHTPISKKTRAAGKRKLENENVKDDEIQSKTPMASGCAAGSETPRRSARKSVRPPLDYEDIMLRSASKLSVIGNTTGPASMDNENDELETHKWSVAEVGRHSAKIKRSRKSKRTGRMHIKEIQDSVNVAAKPEEVPDQKDTTEQALMNEGNLEDPEVMKTEADANEQECKTDDKSENQEIVEAKAEPIDVKSEKTESDSATQEIQRAVKSENLNGIKLQEEQNMELIVTSEDINPTESEGQLLVPTTKSNSLEELGVFPLEVNEEMPSLIVVDDDEDLPETRETALNTTFDADAQECGETFETEMPTLQMSPEKQPTVKLLLTKADDDVPIVLNPDQAIEEKRSRPYRLPTPFKTKVGKSVTNTPTLGVNEEMIPQDNGQRRRSKSFSTMRDIKAKTVSFLSPIEVAHVDDIDKRWDDLNKSNVTQRRRRSKSLDGNLPKPSRLPQPKIFPKILTPSKLKTRTKLPNFAAMHQKQFDKMENLVDHLERKAERAKILTNSALKKQKQPSSSQDLAAEDQSKPPRALKKINLSIAPKVVTPGKRVTPAKEKANVSMRAPLGQSANSYAAKPAFNLSTSLAKTFNAKAAVPSSTSNKLEQRRQRHMEMFKQRPGNDKKADFIRGVRLNRRFELQMQHRRVMEEED
ncbi:enolase-phosphatase E1 [Drosophila tropicalis]|uniref:enolase-phosphatase E1 n=1 Tax=Drosophila tropicalis TaxID=46794 RepID=UPI0035ABA7AC